jgi:hypothetical protein
MKIPFVNPVGFASEKKSSAAEPGYESANFQAILQSKITDAIGPSNIRTGLLDRDIQLFGRASRQSLSDRERMILRAKGQEAIKWLSRRFGMPEGFMNLILQQLGINAEDLADPETRDIALKAIMEYFDLSEEEQKTLKEDFNFFMEGLDF